MTTLPWVAGIAGATPHDARHTFAVHAAQAVIPIVPLQKLLGHADPTMTLRYMKHTPEAYLDQHASAIATHMTGAGDREGEARRGRETGDSAGVRIAGETYT